MRIFKLLRWATGLSLFLFLIANAAPVTDNLELNADDISRDYQNRTVTLIGHVVIKYGDEALYCDKAVINMKTQQIKAEGNVRLESGDNYVEGEKIEYNYRTKLGEIHHGFVQSGNVVFTGDIIKKNSENNFVATSAQFTTCNTCPPFWSFTGSEIEAEMGGYASIKYPVLKIGNLPVFWAPRIWVPLKSERQSGILVPSLENSSRGGTAITLPYFWAISRNQDLTYTLKSYEKRGFKHLTEYRYVLAENSRGNINAGFLRDQNFTDSGSTNGINPNSFNRGFLTYQHYYELPHQFIHRADFNLATDLRYPRDFSEEMGGHGDPALENKFSITKNGSWYHLSSEADYYTNLLKENPRADNSDSVHRMPEVTFSTMEHELYNTNLFFKFDFDYTHFARKDFSYDDVTGTGQSRTPKQLRDGSFNYDVTDNDQIRTGHRYIFQPTVSYPFHIGSIVDVNPSVTYNLAEYRFNVDPVVAPIPDGKLYERNAERNFVQTDISMKTKYSAVYGEDPTNPRATKYKHEIEPEIIHSRIPHADRSNHIFFGDFSDQPWARHNEALSDDDFKGQTGIQFDYRDRLFDKNIGTFNLSNYLIRKIFNNDTPSYQRFLTFRLSQSYDFNNAKTEDPKPWSPITALLDVREDSFETHTTADYYPYAKVTNWSTRLKFISELKNYLELTYSKSIIVNEEQDRTNEITETFGTGLGFKSKYLDLVGRTNYSIITNRLESWEYVSSLKPPGSCWAIKFGHKRNLGADTVFKFSLNFDFGGI